MTIEIALGVLQVAVPVAIAAIEGLSERITSWIKKRKERNLLVEKGLEDALDGLVFNLNFFKGLSQRATNKQEDDAALQVWLENLKEILYDAEDLLDEYATDVAVREMDMEESRIAVDTTASKRNWKAKVRETLKSLIPIKNTVKKPEELAKKVTNILGSLAKLQEKAALLGLQNSETENKVNLRWRQTTSTLESYPMVGRVDEVRKIKQALLQGCGLDEQEKMVEGTSSTNRNQKPSLCVIPIVGMGGIGKTTLARNLYNDDELQHLFDLRAWVCVSDNFDKLAILRKTINSIYFLQGRGEECKWSDLQQLEDELVKVVHGHRLLLVLDDIWTDKKLEWTSLLNPLEAAARNMGACAILVTSRIVSINSGIRRCLNPTHLESLREEDIWTVFVEYAFENMSLSGYEHERLKSIGEGICERLKGSPLAAKSIGTLLASEHTIEHWEAVAGSDLWAVAKNKDDIIPILRLSYEYFPGYLKQCLRYLSLFPKDCKMEGRDIVHLWMAHNCIQPERNEQAVEDTGKKYLEFLVGRSFLEVDQDDRYSMHDLIHDTLQSVSKHEFCLLEQGRGQGRAKEIIPVQVRHVSHFSESFIQEDKEWSSLVMEIKENASKYKKLRSLVRVGTDIYSPNVFGIAEVNLDHLLSHLTLLRVLVIKNCRLKDLPESTGNLKHLRLLNISQNYLEKLPESIGFLHNLLVLNLSECGELECLPNTMLRLVNLRYLHYDKPIDVKGIGRLVSLRSDLCFSVRQESGFHLEELKCLNELQGSLDIRNLDLVRSQEDAEAAQIGNKTHLWRLDLHWSRGRNADSLPFETMAREEEVLEALKPCQAIEYIEIWKYGGRKHPSWLNNTWLVSLKWITLCDVNMENLPPSLSKMPSLKGLYIDGAPKLKYMRLHTGVSDSSVSVAFPMLEHLHLRKMSACEGFRIEEEAVGKPPVSVILPKLKDLTLDSCPNLEEWFPMQAPVLEELSVESVPPFLSSGSRGGLTSLGVISCQTYPYLKDLTIKDIQGMDNQLLASFLSSGSSGDLTSLRVDGCPNITSCDLSALTSLKNVWITKCENITACRLPPAPAALESLFISQCHRLAAVWLSSPALSIDLLHIQDCPKLLYFGTNPSTDDHPSSFSWSSEDAYYCPRMLTIWQCRGEQLSRLLHAIYYTNLETLEISGCSDIEHFNDDDELQSLPPDIGSKLLRLQRIRLSRCPLLSSLPDLHPLPSLRVLDVRGCPLLENSPEVDLLISSKKLQRYFDQWA